MGLHDAVERRYSLAQKLWWLILGRLVAALLLFFVRVVWVHGSGQRAWPQMLPALLIVCGLSLLYTLAHQSSRTLLLQTRVQFVVDIMLATWLVWSTDVIHSPYIALYIVIIAASSLFLGSRDAMLAQLRLQPVRLRYLQALASPRPGICLGPAVPRLFSL